MTAKRQRATHAQVQELENRVLHYKEMSDEYQEMLREARSRRDIAEAEIKKLRATVNRLKYLLSESHLDNAHKAGYITRTKESEVPEDRRQHERRQMTEEMREMGHVRNFDLPHRRHVGMQNTLFGNHRNHRSDEERLIDDICSKDWWEL